jgi:hypothetical protein
VQPDCLVSEVNRGHGLIQHGLVVDVSPENGGFPYTTVPNQDDLVLGPIEGRFLWCHIIKL